MEVAEKGKVQRGHRRPSGYSWDLWAQIPVWRGSHLTGAEQLLVVSGSPLTTSTLA